MAQRDDTHPAQPADPERRIDDFGMPIPEPEPERPIAPLHESHITSARIYLLRDEPQRAREILARPGSEVTDTFDLRLAIQASHLYAEASLEIGGRRAIAQAVESAQLGLALATNHALAGQIEPLYGDAMALTLLEALRRQGSFRQPEFQRLSALLEQISANNTDTRYRALEYVGYRTLALAMNMYEKGRPPALDRALRARAAYLAAAGDTTPRDETLNSGPDINKIYMQHRSALLSALIDFPYPSQGEAGWSNLTRRRRRHG